MADVINNTNTYAPIHKMYQGDIDIIKMYHPDIINKAYQGADDTFRYMIDNQISGISMSRALIRGMEGKVTKLTVMSSAPWTLSCDSDKITLGAASGVGRTEVNVSFGNTWSDGDTATITASNGFFNVTAQCIYRKECPVECVVNYNAKLYNSTNKCIEPDPGQSLQVNLDVSNRVSNAYADRLSIINCNVTNNSAKISFSSKDENPFFISPSTNTTILYKVAPEQIANRGGRMMSTRYFGSWNVMTAGCNDDLMGYRVTTYGSTYVLHVNSLTNIILEQVKSGVFKIKSITDNIEYSSNTIYNYSKATGIDIFHGGAGNEGYSGDFYWLFYANKALSDDEIQEVIEYNESL